MHRETIKTRSLKHLLLQRGRILLIESDFEEFAENLTIYETDEYYEVILSKSGAKEAHRIDKKLFKFYIQVNKKLDESDIQSGNYQICDEFLKRHYGKRLTSKKNLTGEWGEWGEWGEGRLFFLLVILNVLPFITNTIYFDKFLVLTNSVYILYIISREKKLTIPFLSLPVLIYVVFRHDVSLQHIQVVLLTLYILSQCKNPTYAGITFLCGIYLLIVNDEQQFNGLHSANVLNLIVWLYLFYYWIFYGVNDIVFLHRFFLLLFAGIYSSHNAVIISWIFISLAFSIFSKGKEYGISKREHS